MRAIVVDDEPNAISLFKSECAEIENFTIEADFTSGLDAIEYVKDNKVDVAFLDVEMPEINGIELGKELLKLLPGIVLVYISAYDAYAMEAYRLHAPVYLEKPYSKSDIIYALKTVKRLIQDQQERKSEDRAGNSIFVRTFGYFDVFINGEIVHFHNKKSKELLALLVDRRGGSISNDQAISCLWENSVNDIYSQNRLRRAVKDLKDTLQEAGIPDMLISRYSSRAVNTTLFNCDYYWLLDGDEQYKDAYNGKYMQEYSWAEETAADLYRLCGV